MSLFRNRSMRATLPSAGAPRLTTAIPPIPTDAPVPTPADGLPSDLAPEGHRGAPRDVPATRDVPTPGGVDDIPLRRLLAAELAALSADPVESHRSRETVAA